VPRGTQRFSVRLYVLCVSVVQKPKLRRSYIDLAVSKTYLYL
jgi:hypothetical protein